MKKINTLNDLLIEELAELLNAESQLVEALPKIIAACQSISLKLFLEAHLEVSKGHAYRLQDIFNNILQSPQKVTCKAVKELIAECDNEPSKTEARDSAIISLTQRMEQYEIAGYQVACEHAIELGHTKIVELMNKTLNEERSMYLYLNELAQGMINAQAIDPKGVGRQTNQQKGGGFYIPEGGRLAQKGIKKKPKQEISRFISEGNPNIQEP